VKFRKTTGNTIALDLRVLADYVAKEDAEFRGWLAIWFNTEMDTMVDDDVFGTEGQCDPRGDHR